MLYFSRSLNLNCALISFALCSFQNLMSCDLLTLMPDISTSLGFLFLTLPSDVALRVGASGAAADDDAAACLPLGASAAGACCFTSFGPAFAFAVGGASLDSLLLILFWLDSSAGFLVFGVLSLGLLVLDCLPFFCVLSASVFFDYFLRFIAFCGCWASCS